MTANNTNRHLETYMCDCCDIDDGRQTFRWETKDFDLCLKCLKDLFFEHIAPGYKNVEKLIVRRSAISEKTRQIVFERDSFVCQGRDCNATKHLQVDHIRPFSLGGSTELSNLQTLCKRCNKKKGNAE